MRRPPPARVARHLPRVAWEDPLRLIPERTQLTLLLPREAGRGTMRSMVEGDHAKHGGGSGLANRCLGAAGALDLLFGVAEGAEHPVVKPDPARLREEMRADIFPDRLAFVRHLEYPAVTALADQRVAVGEALCTGDVGAEKFEDRLVGIAPHDLAGFRVDLDNARERHRIVMPVRAVVED